MRIDVGIAYAARRSHTAIVLAQLAVALIAASPGVLAGKTVAISDADIVSSVKELGDN
jgi:hypothetical protein